MASYLIGDFPLYIVFNDTLYGGVNFSYTHSYETKEEADAAADLYLGTFGLKLTGYGIPYPVAALRPNETEHMPFQLLHTQKHAAGTFSWGRNNVTFPSYTVASGSSGTGQFPTSPYFPRQFTENRESSTERYVSAMMNCLPTSVLAADGTIDVDASGSIYVGTASFSYRVYQESSNVWTFSAYITGTGTSGATLSTVKSAMGDLKPVENTDPYSQGEESESIAPTGSSFFTGIGGNGTYTSPGYSGGVPSLPTLSAVDTGLLRLYCSSNAVGMNGLANYLWSSAFDLDTFKKLFADPMELIFGAAILPCTPANTASVIIFGNVNTGVSMPQATAQYVSVDCGGLNIPLYYGTFLDYAPHTKISIYLPYIGMRELNATEIVGKTLGVVYHVDVLTGACVAFVTVNSVVMYEYSGSCAVQIPITSNNWASVLQSLATIGGSAIGGFAVGGPVGAVVAGGASAAANAVSGGLTPSFSRGGSVSGSAGLLADQNPYIVMEIPNMCKASGQNWFEGYPNYTTQKLSMCEGFTRVQSVHLEGIGCTATELTEIESILKGGVVI